MRASLAHLRIGPLLMIVGLLKLVGCAGQCNWHPLGVISYKAGPTLALLSQQET